MLEGVAAKQARAERFAIRLWAEGHEPIEVRPGDSIYVGRHPCNDLVLHHMSASRFHAVLEWPQGAPRPLLRDRSSGNGTWLDGQRLSRDGNGHPLHGGEALRFGTLRVSLELRCDGFAAPALLPDQDEALILFSDVGGSFSDYAFDQSSLQRVLYDLEQMRRTGALRFQSDGFSALLTFCMGTIVAAQSPQERDAEVVVARVLECRHGSYGFSRSFEPVEAELELSVAEILRAQREETSRFAKLGSDEAEQAQVTGGSPFEPVKLDDSALFAESEIGLVDVEFDLFEEPDSAPAGTLDVSQPAADDWCFDVSDVLDAPVFESGADEDEFSIDLSDLGLDPSEVWSA
jgi:hypothetical protein